jgi:hypothetical protein
MKKNFFAAIVFAFACFYITPKAIAAPDKIAFTIAPPKIENKINPGESWASAIAVINNGIDPITVYANVVDFRGKDGGGVEYIKNINTATGSENLYLSRWISIPQDPITILPQEKKFIPFSIVVPADAEAGGHYAAIMMGTRPQDKESGSYVNISSMLSCLILLDVKGNVYERGIIREFSTEKSFYQHPESDFKVVFENKGNIHLQPQGEIRIFNYFGKEAGVIPINQKSEYGNVLPNSKRAWDFEWQGEGGILSMGRYKAVLALAYGNEARQTDSRILYFWVADLKIIALILSGFIFFILSIVVIARLSVRRAIRQAQLEAGIVIERKKKN